MPLSPYAGGIKAISRWLSEATPPELVTTSTIFESRRDSRLNRRFGVDSTMSLPKECDPAGIDRTLELQFRWRRFAQPPANR